MLTSQSFLPYLTDNCGVAIGDKILVGVSGGADSMALLHLLKQAGMDCEAAHVNFMLRASESDGDEVLVADYCRRNGVVLHVAHFDTAGIAKQTGRSIEMAARDLRYDWFGKLLVDRGCTAVAVGHHLNDSVETFFINLMRGTGIHGLTGIKPRNGNVVRPLLFCSRSDVEEYCRRNHIPWRTDSSNLEDDYLRNRIRHHIVPQFGEMNPSFLQTMAQNMGRLHQLEHLLADAVEKMREELVAEADGTLLIPVKLIKKHRHKELLLFELLSGKGFNAVQIGDVLRSLDGLAGKQFFSTTHRLVRDRDNLIVVPKADDATGEVGYIESGQGECVYPIGLVLREFDCYDGFEFSRDANCIHVDADRVDFPLTVRKWRQGDAFMPIGMEQFKKLSDFFVDAKMSLVDKERTWLLLSGDDIMWVVGRRVDNRFKVTGKTKRILEIMKSGQ